MPTTYIVKSSDLEKLKQKARKLKKAESVPHHQALELVAQEMGLPNWHQVTLSAQVTSLTEKAYYMGLIIAMDVKDADGFHPGDEFVEDQQAYEFCQQELVEAYRQACEEDGEPATDEDVQEYLFVEMMNFVFFRFTGNSIPESPDQVLKLVQKHSFWPPQCMWLHNEFIDTYLVSALDDEGAIVGVRF